VAKITFLTLITAFLMAGQFCAAAQNPFLSKEAPSKAPASEVAPKPVFKYPFLAKIALWQQKLKQEMSTLTRQAKETRSLRPLLFLIILAFAYGVLHAAGPGHGKAVAVSYLMSHGKKLSSGILVGNLIAGFHGVSGVVFVLSVSFVVQKTITGSVESVSRTTQLISYSLIALLGAGMLLKTLVSWQRESNGQEGDPDRRTALVRGMTLPMAFAVGLVPCPGVVLVMLFCVSLNVIGLGLVLASFQTLGMAFTISAVGTVALAGKQLALSATGHHEKLSHLVQRAIETAAALAVLLLGVLLLLAAF
jgi:ABC-type nickel/cobalt efflux system permease component RcnA